MRRKGFWTAALMLAVMLALTGYAGASSGEITCPVEGGNLYFRVNRSSNTAYVSDCDETVTSAVIPAEIEGVPVTWIGSGAFWNCNSLSSVEFPAGVTEIGDWAFQSCYSLASLEFPVSVTAIGVRAFSGCRSLSSVELPIGVTAIGEDAFHSCSSLKTAHFLGNAPSAGDGVFDYTHDSFRILFHKGTAGWTSPTWNGYASACVDQDLSDYSTLDAENRNAQKILFTLNDSAMTATVGDGSTAHNNSNFRGEGGDCTIIPDTVTKDGKTYRVVGIGQHAFDSCHALQSLQLGANISSIGEGAFWDCENFTAFTAAEENRNYSAPDGVLYDKMQYQLYVYPAGREGASYEIPATVDRIGKSAFYSAENLTELTVPDTVLDIGRNAFYNCTGLRTLTLPFLGGSREDFGDFDYVYGNSYNIDAGLRSVTITQETLKGEDFSGCGYLTDITVLTKITEIPPSAFNNCYNLVRLSLNGEEAVTGTVGISSRITEIGSSAFYRCTALSAFDVAEDNPNYCSDRWGVLFNKDKSTLISYPAARQWPYYNVPEETASIRSGAFYGCQTLVNLFIPSTVTSLVSGYDSSINACPNTTICVYRGSPAAQYAAGNNLTNWYIDNYTMQGITVYSLPEQTTFAAGEVDFRGLYLAASYGGRELQLDDYTLEYDPERVGRQEVVVRAKANPELTAAFSIEIMPRENRTLIFDLPALPAGCTGYAALYQSGRLAALYSPKLEGGTASVYLGESEYQAADRIALFLVKGDHTPAAPAVEYHK